MTKDEKPMMNDVEVAAKPRRRQFTAAYKLKVVTEADAAKASGDVGRLLRREGLYSSHLTAWRKARREGELGALGPRKRGRKPVERDRVAQENRRLKRDLDRTREQLRRAEVIIDVQGKVAGLLGFSLEDGKDS
jgi:transposase InsO family protein